MVDSLSTTFNTINIARSVGKKSCVVGPKSKLLIGMLEIMKKNGYIDNYEIINSDQAGIGTISSTELKISEGNGTGEIYPIASAA